MAGRGRPKLNVSNVLPRDRSNSDSSLSSGLSCSSSGDNGDNTDVCSSSTTSESGLYLSSSPSCIYLSSRIDTNELDMAW